MLVFGVRGPYAHAIASHDDTAKPSASQAPGQVLDQRRRSGPWSASSAANDLRRSFRCHQLERLHQPLPRDRARVLRGGVDERSRPVRAVATSRRSRVGARRTGAGGRVGSGCADGVPHGRSGRQRALVPRPVGGGAGQLETAGLHHGFLLDITEQKELEQALRRERQYFQELLSLSPTAIVTLDLERRVTSWNPAADRLFGYAEAEARGRLLDELVVHVETDNYERWMTQSGDSGEVGRCRRRDGGLVDVGLVTAPLEVDGVESGTLVVYHDVSGITQVERRLRVLVEELPLVLYIDSPPGSRPDEVEGKAPPWPARASISARRSRRCSGIR